MLGFMLSQRHCHQIEGPECRYRRKRQSWKVLIAYPAFRWTDGHIVGSNRNDAQFLFREPLLRFWRMSRLRSMCHHQSLFEPPETSKILQNRFDLCCDPSLWTHTKYHFHHRPRTAREQRYLPVDQGIQKPGNASRNGVFIPCTFDPTVRCKTSVG